MKKKKNYVNFAFTRDKRRVSSNFRIVMKYFFSKQKQSNRKKSIQRRFKITSIDRKLRRKRFEHKLIIFILQNFLYAEKKREFNDLRINVIIFNVIFYDDDHQ